MIEAVRAIAHAKFLETRNDEIGHGVRQDFLVTFQKQLEPRPFRAPNAIEYPTADMGVAGGVEIPVAIVGNHEPSNPFQRHVFGSEELPRRGHDSLRSGRFWKQQP